MWIRSATEESQWYELDLNMFNNEDDATEIQIKNSDELNEEIVNTFPELYNDLIETITSKNIRPIIEPLNIPTNASNSSKYLSMIKILGKVLATSMTIALLFHCIATIIICACIMLPIFCCVQQPKSNGLARNVYNLIIFQFPYAGMVISPILITHIILSNHDIYSEIQSWMIAYIMWGIMSFFISFSYTISAIFEKHKMEEVITTILFLIIGVDFGGANGVDIIGSSDNSKVKFGLIYIFPAFASFLPAAICGFIANFILEEKFVLKCRDDITNQELCFTESYGCCEVVSSHDVASSYTFIGGLTSNILAIWALIRISGYLVINAFDELSLYAKRTK